ncbi:MAG TPA: 3D domain-containing protein [Chloroflexota bacterium]|nr:3D domain-containing protein [Chloroflexota bacterium]
MIRSKFFRLGAHAAFAGALLIWGLGLQTGAAAAAPDDGAGRAWDARVQNTGMQGLQVRQGPGLDYPTLGVLPEGAYVHVVSGPRFDQDGRDWYQVTGFTQAGTLGWSAGDYLVAGPPAPANAQTTLQAAGTGVAAAGGQSFVATVTAYTYQTPGNGAHGSLTRSGTLAHWGTVAVDPRVIPLGSRLLIDGYSDVFTAEDTGGAVVGNHVEIFFTDSASALQFGVQQRNVTVLPEAASSR